MRDMTTAVEATKAQVIAGQPGPDRAPGDADESGASTAPRGLPRAHAWGRASGPARMAMKAMLRALAGEEPELPPREPGKRSRERLAAEMVWIWWALKAGCTKRAIMLKLGISKSTCKRRLRAIRQELAWQLGDGKDEDALAIEWEARLAILRSGQVPPPLTPKRELQLMELAESVVSFYAPDLYDPAPESPERGSGRRDLA